MKVLVGWDSESEAETIDLLLNAEVQIATIVTSAQQFEDYLKNETWDAILLALTFPNEDESFDLFLKIRKAQPEVPVVAAWQHGEIVRLARFMQEGLHSYVARDANGEFIFLLPSLMEAAHAAVQAERARVLAERLREEIDSVRQLQESVIPRDMPAPDGYKLAARYEPSQIQVLGDRPVVMAGGDYYDAFPLSDDTLIALVGDASGHGMKACMSIMTMHTLIRMLRDQAYSNTVDFVANVNQRLCENEIVSDDGGFITLLYCVLHADRHELEWTSAGHPMPLLQNRTTNEVTRLGSSEESGLPLCIEADWTYSACTAEVPENSRILLYTDGLEEAFPESGDDTGQFGEEGIIASLKSSVNMDLEDAMKKLFYDSHEATAGSGRHDDTSVVLVERIHNGTS